MPAISSGPGETYVKPQAAGRGGGGIGGVATHTPDGKAIKVNAPPCDYCGEPIIGTNAFFFPFSSGDFVSPYKYTKTNKNKTKTQQTKQKNTREVFVERQNNTKQNKICKCYITGRVTNALGKMFHPEHFVCANCSQPFRDGKFVEHEGKPYCSDHYFELFAPRCFRCAPFFQRCSRIYAGTPFPMISVIYAFVPLSCCLCLHSIELLTTSNAVYQKQMRTAYQREDSQGVGTLVAPKPLHLHRLWR